MLYPSLADVLALHAKAIAQSGGSLGVRDMGGVESALAQPRMSFGGEDLYPTLAEKAAALGFSLVKNHPFVDGNKRIGHAAMETFLLLNDVELDALVDEQEQVILQVADSTMSRDDFTAWVAAHIVARPLPA